MQSIANDKTNAMELLEELPSTNIDLKEAGQLSDTLAAGAGRSHQAPCHVQYTIKPRDGHRSSTGGDDTLKLERKTSGPVPNDSYLACMKQVGRHSDENTDSGALGQLPPYSTTTPVTALPTVTGTNIKIGTNNTQQFNSFFSD